RAVAGAVRRRGLPGRRGDPVHRRAGGMAGRNEERRCMNGIEDRVLALGGMLQALAQVRRIADTGQSESTPVQVALDSVFRIDAADTAAVYGDAASLRAGLRLLRDYLGNNNKDE